MITLKNNISIDKYIAPSTLIRYLKKKKISLSIDQVEFLTTINILKKDSILTPENLNSIFLGLIANLPNIGESRDDYYITYLKVLDKIPTNNLDLWVEFFLKVDSFYDKKPEPDYFLEKRKELFKLLALDNYEKEDNIKRLLYHLKNSRVTFLYLLTRGTNLIYEKYIKKSNAKSFQKVLYQKYILPEEMLVLLILKYAYSDDKFDNIILEECSLYQFKKFLEDVLLKREVKRFISPLEVQIMKNKKQREVYLDYLKLTGEKPNKEK
jgi:hypothetical protein